MKIDDFKINNYGKIENSEVFLQNGINLIKGYNEAGKSTILSFLNSMLYGIDKTKKGNISEYDKYLPWLSTNFSGSMNYRLDNGNNYYVFRDFKKITPIILDRNRNDITANFKQSKKGIDFLEGQIGVDKKTFQNTSISYQKLVILDDKNKAEMSGKLANLISTGEENYSYDDIIKRLNNKQLEEVGTSRTKKRPINNLEERILKLEQERREVLNIKDKKERMTEEREETQKKFATVGYIKQMITEIKENFLKKETEKKIYTEIYNRIEKKKEEIEHTSKELVGFMNDKEIIGRCKEIIEKHIPILLLDNNLKFIQDITNEILSENNIPIQIEIIIDNTTIVIPCTVEDTTVPDASMLSAGETCLISLLLNASILHLLGYNILCLDEIDANLDVDRRKQFNNIVVSIMSKLDIDQICCISHNISSTIDSATIVQIGEFSNDFLSTDILYINRR